jgi:predicted alpha/beta hydrolase family esterase
MPSKENAYYPAWKIWFEKYFQYIHHMPETHDNQSTLDRIEAKKQLPHIPLILIGHSLGATFLMKYISEHGFPKEIDTLHLIAPALDDAGLIGESLSTFLPTMSHIPSIHKYVKHTHIWASTDDRVIPYDHSVRAHVAIVGSVLHTFHDRGHFATGSHFVELFQEVVKHISKD